MDLLRRTTPALLFLALGCEALAMPSGDARSRDEPESSAPAPEEIAPQAAEPELAEPEPTKPEPTKPELSSVTEAVRAEANALTEHIDEGYLGYDFRTADNALPLLHLANGHADPVVVAAALEALATVYGSRSSDDSPGVDEDYVAVVAYRLQNTEAMVMDSALVAAKTGMELRPSPKSLRKALLGVAEHHAHPSARISALEALAYAKPMTGDVQQAFMRAFDSDDPTYAALALNAIENFAGRFSDHDALRAKLNILIESPSPALRGAAIAVLPNLATAKPDQQALVASLARPLLKDEHPYVRGEAVFALGQTFDLRYAKDIASVLDDDDDAVLPLEGWTKIDGSRAGRAMRASGSGNITATALLSLAILSARSDHPFEYVEDIVRGEGLGNDDYGPAVAKAKAWVERYGE